MKDEDKVKGVCVLLNLFLNIKVTKSDRMKLTHSNRRTQALAQTNTSFSCLSTPLIPALNCRDPEWQTVAPPSNPNQKIYLIHTPTNPHLHTHTLTHFSPLSRSLYVVFQHFYTYWCEQWGMAIRRESVFWLDDWLDKGRGYNKIPYFYWGSLSAPEKSISSEDVNKNKQFLKSLNPFLLSVFTQELWVNFTNDCTSNIKFWRMK